MKYTDTNIGHYAESILQLFGNFIPWFFIAFNIYAFLVASLFIFIRGGMRHDHRFTWLISNHHLLHHKFHNCNFGEYYLDCLLGTQCKREEEYKYGLFYL